MERALARREEVFQLFKHAFTADVVIITLGLIECWWDNERNRYVHPMPPIKELGRKNERFVFKQLHFHEAYDYIAKTIELVKERGREDARILITTSRCRSTRRSPIRTFCSPTLTRSRCFAPLPGKSTGSFRMWIISRAMRA